MEEHSNGANPSRRRLLKGAVGVGAGAAVWSSPSIHGFARTPAFAQGGSVICQNVNSFQWNPQGQKNNFGWNGQPCGGANDSPYTVDPTGGVSDCAGAWGDAQVKLVGDKVNDQVIITIEPGSLDPNCYIVEAQAIETSGTSCNTQTTGNTTTKTLMLDMSCITTGNLRIDIEIDCPGGLGC